MAKNQILALILLLMPRPAGADVFDLSMRPKAKSATEFAEFEVPKIGGRQAEKPKTWPALLAATPVAFWHQILIHEGSHVLAGTAIGIRTTGFYPYPHVHKGNLYMGRVATDDRDDEPAGKRVLFSMAPSISDILAFSVCDAMLSSGTPSPGSMGESIVFMMGMVAPTVDFVANFISSSDWRKARDAAGSKAWMLDAAAAMAAGVMLWRTIVHARRVFRHAW